MPTGSKTDPFKFFDQALPAGATSHFDYLTMIASDTTKPVDLSRMNISIEGKQLEYLMRNDPDPLKEGLYKNADGTYNFKDVDLYPRNGTANQTLIPLQSSSSVLSGTVVNTPVKKNFPIVRTITDITVDAVRLVITIPVLQKINNKNGDTLGTNVQLKIEIKYTSATDSNVYSDWFEKFDDTIRGRTADSYTDNMRFDLIEKPTIIIL